MSLLPEHSHCLSCDAPVDVGQDYCSEECRAKAETEARRERARTIAFLGLTMAVLIAVMLFMALG